MFVLPTQQAVAPEARASAEIEPRYEDIAQDGRMVVGALPPALSTVVWRDLLGNHPMREVFRSSGILPILRRVVVRTEDSRIAVHNPITAHGSYAFARQAASGTSTARLLLNMWVSVDGISDRTFGPPPVDKGASVPLGEVFAEHVFTRLFAPPAERRVEALVIDGKPFEPEWNYVPPPMEQAGELPMGARGLEDTPVADPSTVSFGLSHTDSNQHVNSLVYPRLFEEAALRRFHQHGRSTAVLARELEISYRKPFFAGDTARIWLRCFELDGYLGAAGFISGGGSAVADKPHCYLRMVFR